MLCSRMDYGCRVYHWHIFGHFSFGGLTFGYVDRGFGVIPAGLAHLQAVGFLDGAYSSIGEG